MMTIHRLFKTPTTLSMRTVTSSSVFLNKVGIWLCPILSAEIEFD